MTRLHPDDIQAIAERVILLMRSDIPAPAVDALTISRMRLSAREEIAKAEIRKQQKLEKRKAA